MPLSQLALIHDSQPMMVVTSLMTRTTTLNSLPQLAQVKQIRPLHIKAELGPLPYHSITIHLYENAQYTRPPTYPPTFPECPTSLKMSHLPRTTFPPHRPSGTPPSSTHPRGPRPSIQGPSSGPLASGARMSRGGLDLRSWLFGVGQPQTLGQRTLCMASARIAAMALVL